MPNFKIIALCFLHLEPHIAVTLHDDLEEHLGQISKPYLLVGDFNAHSGLEGNRQMDSRDSVLDDFILCDNVCLLNAGKHA